MITEIKKLRELTEALTGNGYLRDQAEEWEYALDAIPNPIFIINNNYLIKFVNKALAKRLGVNKEDCVDRTCYEFIRGLPEGIIPEDWKTEGEKTNIPPIKGEYIENLGGWFDTTRSPIYTKTNKLLGFICVLQDITSEKKALEKLQWRESMLKTIFMASPIGLGMLERDTRVLKAVNKTFLDLVGYSEEELIGETTEVLYPTKEEFDRVGAEKYSKINEFGHSEVETTWVTKNGNHITVLIKSARMKDSEDVVFSVSDITNTKQNEQKMSLFIEQTPLAVVGCDLDFKITTWNKAAENMFGFTSEEAVGQHIYFITPKTERERVDKMWKSLTKGEDKVFTHTSITKEGDLLACKWYNKQIVDSLGEAVGIVSLIMCESDKII